MPRRADAAAALVGIGEPCEAAHVHGTQPARVAVELLDSQPMPRDQHHPAPLASQPERDLGPRDARPDHGDHRVLRVVHQLEARVEEVPDPAFSPGSHAAVRGGDRAIGPIRPLRRARRADRQDHVPRLDRAGIPVIAGILEAHPHARRREIEPVRVAPDVELLKPVSLDHVLAMEVEEREGGPGVGPREGPLDASPPTPGEVVHRSRGQIDVVDAGRAKVTHARVARRPAPSCEQARLVVEDAYGVVRDARLPNQTDGRVDAMGSPADHEPFEHQWDIVRGTGSAPDPSARDGRSAASSLSSGSRQTSRLAHTRSRSRSTPEKTSSWRRSPKRGCQRARSRRRWKSQSGQALSPRLAHQRPTGKRRCTDPAHEYPKLRSGSLASQTCPFPLTSPGGGLASQSAKRPASKGRARR